MIVLEMMNMIPVNVASVDPCSGKERASVL